RTVMGSLLFAKRRVSAVNPTNIKAKVNIVTKPYEAKSIAGSTVKITVKTTNGVKYKWQVYKNALKRWCDVGDKDTTKYVSPDKKTAVLSFKTCSGNDGNIYRCLIRGSNGEVYSEQAKLTVFGITGDLSNKTAKVGNKVEFKIKAINAKNYQWQKKINGKWVNVTGGTKKVSNGTATLSFKATTSHNGRIYRCVVTGTNGGKLKSKEVKLTVKK
ncbi:MAG: immunoglobulin domain-containing protein, partial [Oscillospiraceae bacterium]|nr:immunoglobulin domain-containing protein [Oscillospiraceae bacterium]